MFSMHSAAPTLNWGWNGAWDGQGQYPCVMGGTIFTQALIAPQRSRTGSRTGYRTDCRTGYRTGGRMGFTTSLNRRVRVNHYIQGGRFAPAHSFGMSPFWALADLQRCVG